MRKLIEGTAGWVFGLALSVLLISVWGRAVVVDSETLSEALAPLSGSGAVVDQFAGWLGDELVAEGVAPGSADALVEAILAESAVDDVLEDLVVEVVAAAARPGRGGVSVDIAEVLAPAIPEITTSLNASGLPTTEQDVQRRLEIVAPLVIRGPGLAPVIGPHSPVAARLGAATLLALIVMGLAGTVYVRSKPDRVIAIRSLLGRIALSGLSFGLMLKLGSWILDPSGGRAPISDAIAGVAAAKWLVPVVLGAIAALGAALTWLWRRRLRPVAATHGSAGEPIPPAAPLRWRSGVR